MHGKISLKDVAVSYLLGVDRQTYHSFLLRMWQVPGIGDVTWRIQLENVKTGEKHGFSSLEDLLTYLNQITAQEYHSTGAGK